MFKPEENKVADLESHVLRHWYCNFSTSCVTSCLTNVATPVSETNVYRKGSIKRRGAYLMFPVKGAELVSTTGKT